MGVFDNIEAEENLKITVLELEAETKKIAEGKLSACPHRRYGGYHLNTNMCKHPDRTPGRLCVDFKCPAIDWLDYLK
jgi:hypothetical protein